MNAKWTHRKEAFGKLSDHSDAVYQLAVPAISAQICQRLLLPDNDNDSNDNSLLKDIC